MKPRGLHRVPWVGGCAALSLTTIPRAAFAVEGHAAGESLPLVLISPFAGLLLTIAILPLIVPHWWESNRNKGIVSAAYGVPMGLYMLVENPAAAAHTALEYTAFIILLGALFVISSGIFLRGDIRATPRNNLLFLTIGSILASFIGTTGAAMLLIRPVLMTNRERKNTRHIPIFFIFAVANMGGMLTPLGDPPLFLGYLRGVPFFWTLKLIPEWLFGVTVVLSIFYLIDRRAYRRERPEDVYFDATRIEPLRVSGAVNFLLLGGILLSVLLVPGAIRADGLGLPYREVTMVGLAAISLFLCPKQPRIDNQFTFHAINEVAVLFAGIFATMIPALLILEARGPELPLQQAWQFFWVTGMLSSFLDNAPTYLTLTSVASGYLGTDANALTTLIAKAAVEGRPAGELVLKAISVGAVFMGANTYIGNGPNFMVKAISDEAGLKTPSFFGYMLWSGLILLPLFVVITFVFF